jgi:hypothetical protein
VSAHLRTPGELAQQPSLSNPGLPDQLDRARAASIKFLERLLQLTDFFGTSDQWICKHAHAASFGGVRQSLS